MVEGRVLFGALVCSAGAVLLSIILGLRYLDGTLGGRYAAGSLLLSAVFVAVVGIALVLSFTDWLGWGSGRTGRGRSASEETRADRDLL